MSKNRLLIRVLFGEDILEPDTIVIGLDSRRVWLKESLTFRDTSLQGERKRHPPAS